MSIFNSFPIMNAYSINLDWILKKIRELEDYVRNYTAVNNVAYAGVWDITKQYPQWALVTDGDTSWLALQPVPVGIPLENAEYWQKLADLDPRISGIIVQLSEVEKQISGTIVKLSEVEKQIAAINASPIIDATKYGVSASDPDIGVTLSKVISDHPGAIIVLPDGSYNATTTITIPVNNTIVYCAGDINSSAPIGFKIKASHVRLFVNHAIGNGNNIFLQYGSEDMAESYGNSFLEVNVVDEFNIGVKYLANGENGIQNVVLTYSRINRCNTGILLQCGNTSKPWINQNTFNCGWINSGIENSVGIKFVKGANQVDQFNGNVFNCFSCENTRYPIDLDFAFYNKFNYFRLLENVGDNLIKLTNTCESNTFIGASAWVSYKSINDNGANNEYKMTFHNDENNNICTAATFISGVFVPMGLIYTSKVFTTDRGASIPETEKPYLIVFDGSMYNVSVTMPIAYNLVRTANPFFLKIGAKAGTASVSLYNGTVIANDTNGGSSGVVLEANSTYMFAPKADNNYTVIKIS